MCHPWFSTLHLDPVEAVRKRIIGDDIVPLDEFVAGPLPFTIVDDSGPPSDVEDNMVDTGLDQSSKLRSVRSPSPSYSYPPSSPANPASGLHRDLEFNSSPPSPPILDSSPKPKRWVPYRTTLFKWDILPISLIHYPLPALSSAPAKSATYTEDRAALWRKIVGGDIEQQLFVVTSSMLAPTKIPPWRRPEIWTTTAAHQSKFPMNNLLAFMPPRTSLREVAKIPLVIPPADDVDSDMDISD